MNEVTGGGVGVVGVVVVLDVPVEQVFARNGQSQPATNGTLPAARAATRMDRTIPRTSPYYQDQVAVSRRQPVGVLDSGVGGLSILREIRAALPHEDLIYVADSRYAPYGERTETFIEQRVTAIVEYLIAEGAKAVVVACNTATGVAIEALRSQFRIPIVAIEPALKPAAAMTRSGIVGVLATHRTLESEKFARLRERHAAGVDVMIQPCPGLAEQVEHGEFASAATRAMVSDYVRPLVDKGVDTLVLGCTHYPFLQPLIREVAGPGVTIVDPGDAIARELVRQLGREHLLSDHDRNGTTRFVTSGDMEQVRRVIDQLWKDSVTVEPLPERFLIAGLP